MGRTAWRSVVLGVLFGLGLGFGLPRAAHAQAEAPPATAPVIETSSPGLQLPQVPWLRLALPVTPLRFSFSASEEGNYAKGPLLLFRTESLWLQAGPFQALTVTSAERDVVLDCSGLTCQPVIKNIFAVDARLALPRVTPHVQSSYAYVRSSWSRTPQLIGPRDSRSLSVGLAGTF